MKSKTTVYITSLLIAVSIGFSALARPAAALTCTVLPQNICDMAQKQSAGNTSKDSAVLALLQWVIGILTAGVGVAAVAAFIFAGHAESYRPMPLSYWCCSCFNRARWCRCLAETGWPS